MKHNFIVINLHFVKLSQCNFISMSNQQWFMKMKRGQVRSLSLLRFLESPYKRHHLHREISITSDSKSGLWVLRWWKLTHGDTGLEMCADSTVWEYIAHIHSRSQIVVAKWEGASNCLLGFPCVFNDVCISVHCIMANQYFLLNVYLFMINIC